MFSAAIEVFFKHASAATITEFFLYLITFVFILAVVFSWQVKQPRFTAYASALMTSLGILGTFVGIVIGLLNFDTQNIDGSIPNLLNGLKTAFMTSVYGMVGAVLFNILDAVLFAAKRQRLASAVSHQPQTIQPQHILNVLERQHEVMATILKTMTHTIQPEHIFNSLEQQREVMTNVLKTMNHMQRSLSADEEGSLIGQFKLLRADMSGLSGLQKQFDMSDKKSFAYALNTQVFELRKEFKHFTQVSTTRNDEFNSKLFTALDNFAEMLSRSATEQIIAALKDVIQDFNKNLTEQFGENFKALDASVQKLVIWQAQHKDQVESLTEQYERGAESLRITQESVTGIRNECENIPVSMGQLKVVLDVNQHQIAELGRHLGAFESMRDAAVAAVPTIQRQIEQVGEHLVSSSTDVQQRLQEASAVLVSSSNDMRVSLGDASTHFKDSVISTQQSFSELSNVVKTTTEQVSTTLNTSATELNSQARDTLSLMQSSTKEMQSEVLTTVQDLGAQTSKITQDLSQMAQAFERANQEAVADVKRVSEGMASELNTLLSQSQGMFEAYMKETTQKTGDTLNTQLELLEKATAREIEKAMTTMGSSLVTITSRFVEDYKNMVEAMDQVINGFNRR